MAEPEPHESHRSAKDVIDELQRLRAVSEETVKAFTEIQNKISELQSQMEQLPNGSMRAKQKE